MSSFSIDHAGMADVIAEGLTKRFERELYAAMRKDLDTQLKLFEVQGEEYIRKAAVAAAKAYVAQVHTGIDYKDPFRERKVVLMLDRKEVPIDGRS